MLILLSFYLQLCKPSQLVHNVVTTSRRRRNDVVCYLVLYFHIAISELKKILGIKHSKNSLCSKNPKKITYNVDPCFILFHYIFWRTCEYPVHGLVKGKTMWV